MHFHCLKGNQKGKENKINIKSEKLNKRKEKLSVSEVFHNNSLPKEQQRERAKHASKNQDQKWKRIANRNTGGL